MSATPSFVVVGAAKAATTSVHDALAGHPQVFVPAGKELHWFAAPELTTNRSGPGDTQRVARIVRTREAYDRAFAGAAGHRAVGEVSTSYLAWHEGAAERIHATLGPGTKIIAALRRPGDRSYSQWLHLVREGSETLEFADALDAEDDRAARGWADMWRYAATSRYADAIAHYRELFGADRVHVVLFDDLQAEFEDTMRSLLGFLEVDPDVEVPPVHANRGGLPRSRTLARLVFRESALKQVARAVLPAGPRRWAQERASRIATGGKPPEPGLAARRRVDEANAADVARLEALIGRSTGWRTEPAPMATTRLSVA